MRYILNSAVITTPGVYSYRLITLSEAKEWLSQGSFISAIGYPETAEALQTLTGVSIPVNRVNIKMEDGDEALVFRLTCRVSDPASKGGVGIEFLSQNCEFGILEKKGGKNESEKN